MSLQEAVSTPGTQSGDCYSDRLRTTVERYPSRSSPIGSTEGPVQRVRRSFASGDCGERREDVVDVGVIEARTGWKCPPERFTYHSIPLRGLGAKRTGTLRLCPPGLNSGKSLLCPVVVTSRSGEVCFDRIWGEDWSNRHSSVHYRPVCKCPARGDYLFQMLPTNPWVCDGRNRPVPMMDSIPDLCSSHIFITSFTFSDWFFASFIGTVDGRRVFYRNSLSIGRVT